IIRELSQTKCILQLKDEASKGADLTTAHSFIISNGVFSAKHLDGLHLRPCKVTIMFELNNNKYFSAGKISGVRDGFYSLEFISLFRLQRRNSFRVDIPEQIIDARFKVTLINQTNVAKILRMI